MKTQESLMQYCRRLKDGGLFKYSGVSGITRTLRPGNFYIVQKRDYEPIPVDRIFRRLKVRRTSCYLCRSL